MRNRSAKEAAISSTVFIGNLSFETTEEELRAALLDVDPAVRVRLGTDRVTGRPRGFAFAQFTDAAAATAARSAAPAAAGAGSALASEASASRRLAPRGHRCYTALLSCLCVICPARACGDRLLAQATEKTVSGLPEARSE